MLSTFKALLITAVIATSMPSLGAAELLTAKPTKNLVQQTLAAVAKNKKLAGGIALAGAVMLSLIHI